MVSPTIRPDFRNYTAKLKNKSRSLNKFIRRHLSYIDYNQQVTGSLPSRIQDLIKLVKYWYKEFVPKGQEQNGHEPGLNSIEKSTVDAWRKRNSPKTINIAIAFRAVMEELRDHDQDCGTRHAAMDTMKKPMFVNVSVTKNLCRTPTVQSVVKSTTIAAISRGPSGVKQDDFRELPSANLDKFIAEQLQPDEKFHKLVSTALDNLYHYLQGHMQSPTLKCLIKGGSMGKGTALKDRSDLDCILVMDDSKNACELKQKISGILTQLKGLLDGDPLNEEGWGITIIKVDSFLVQIEMKHLIKRKESVKVDILPTFEAEVDNEDSRNQLYNSMAGYKSYTRELCSTALAKLKRDFIKSKETKIKSLIRLVKHWCKTYLPGQDGQRMPNSYLLELLTISVWEKAGSQDSFNTAQLFKDVMEALCNHTKLDVTWNCYYETSMIKVTSIPRIVDPANPYNNLHGVVKGWKRVKRVAKETLNKPLLKDL